MPRSLGALILSFALLTGCYAPRYSPAVPLPVRLESPTEFRLLQSATPERAATECRVLRAALAVSEIRADTLHFTEATVLRQATGATPCTPSGAGFVVAAEHPDLRVQTFAFDGARSAVAAVVLLVTLPIAGALLIVASWSGT